VDDDKTQTTEEIYEGYEEFIEQAKDALQDEVSSFYSSDTADPRKIAVSYCGKV